MGDLRSVLGNANNTNIQIIPMLRSPLLLGPSITVPGDEDWKKLYTFSEVYSSSYTPEEGLSSNTMRSVVESTENSMRIRRKSSLLTSFRTLLMSGGVSKTQHAGSGIECNDKCKNEWLCTIQSATRDGYDNCLSLRQHTSREKADVILLFSLTAVVLFVFALANYCMMRLFQLKVVSDCQYKIISKDVYNIAFIEAQPIEM